MPNDELINDLLDVWEDLLEQNPRASLEDFLKEQASKHPTAVINELRHKAALLGAVEKRMGAMQDTGSLAGDTLNWDWESKPDLGRLCEGLEAVPGYQLVKRLGAGGFGEVWKAMGPGGFPVALKFVRMQGRAGAIELRSLDVIRDVRHANLLSVFGTWQLNDLLVIATELADKTLQDRYEETVQMGVGGIPLPELLGYMADAAKGIDFLNEPGTSGRPRIQHRDIKPQNLLLSGGSIKVGDFGLARQVQHDATGHTGSLTLAYAAPEFLNGMTSIHSDQYSLAVAYCLLRGGQLPFQGSEIQIIDGHRSGTPDLSMLPEHERPIVAKALAKKPQDRWPSCREFVHELAKAAPVVASSKGTPTVHPQAVAPPATFHEHTLQPFTSSPAPEDTATSQNVLTASRGLSSSVTLQVRKQPPWWQTPVGLCSLGGGGLVVVLLTVVFLLCTPNGLLVIEIDEPGTTVTVDGEQKVWIQSPDGQPAVQVAVDQQQHELKVSKDGFEVFTQQFSMKEKDQQTIRVRLDPLSKPPMVTGPARNPRPAVPTTVPPSSSLVGKTAGEERSDNGLDMKFCWCPPGKFRMGSPTTEKDRGSDEIKVEVTLSQGFWLGKYEVTQGEYEQVMEKNPSSFSATGIGKAKVEGQNTSRFPVEKVSWWDAEEYCQKLTEQERAAGRLPAGWEYRLPTEAQWEYACRAGTTSATAFGDSLSSTQANFDGNSPYNGAGQGPHLGRPTTVGSYAANAWGLHDLHGNVWEWCQDRYGDNLPGGLDPSGATSGLNRVYRGGSWYDYGQNCRSAYRTGRPLGDRSDNQGFRVALVPSNLPTTISPSTAPLQAGQKAGEQWNGNSFGMKFCWCPPGKFRMGSPTTEKERLADRETQVEVTLTQGYWLGKYEVTQAEYEKVMGKNPSYFCVSGSGASKVEGRDTSRFPVEYVSWTDATEYCQKLTEQERAAGRLPDGWKYRLPTEAQWEYACRAKTTTATAFGDSLSSKQANFSGGSPYNGAEKGPYLGRTTTVGSYAPNAWGLYDMHGNVWEWCQDRYGDNLPGGTDPVGASTGSYRVYRGGSWYYDGGQICRSANRYRHSPDLRSFNQGFRVALVPSSQ